MRTPKLALVLVLAAAAGLNCDDDKTSGADAGTGGTGGSAATGGTGGSATGGTGGTGGSAATGGTGGSATGGTGGGTGGTTATGGTGGTAATGGTGGTTATGGTGGTGTGGTGGTPASCEIPCLTNLIAGCVPMGTCMSETKILPTPSINQCYTNGVKMSTAINVSGGGGTVAVTYSKATGVCYTIEAAGAGAGMNFTFTYKNAGGMVVATGTYDNATMKTTLTCAGSATPYDLSNPACANVPRGQMAPTGGGDAGAGNCPMGACP